VGQRGAPEVRFLCVPISVVNPKERQNPKEEQKRKVRTAFSFVLSGGVS